jgi:hypothetical protein
VSVVIDGKALIPAPFVRVARPFDRKSDGTRRPSPFVITLTGKLHAYKGSPRSDGSFHTTSGYPADESISHDYRLKSLEAKVGALTALLDNDGLWLEVYPLDGSAPIKCRPSVRDVQFQEGLWFETVDYTLEFEAERLWFGSTLLDAAPASSLITEDSWQVEAADEGSHTYRLTHTVSAQARRLFDTGSSVEAEGWQRAKEAADAQLGFNATRLQAAGSLNLSAGVAPFNHMRTTSLNKEEGTYTVTETWLCFDPDETPDGVGQGVAAVEEFTVNTRTGLDSGRSQVSIEGSIQGLMSRDGDFAISDSRWSRANAKWAAVSSNLHARCQSFSGLSLNATEVSSSVGKNPWAGTVNYAYEFDDRCAILIAGCRTVSVSMEDTAGGDVFAAIGVIARAAGPVMQTLGTRQADSRTVTVECVLEGGCHSATPPTNVVTGVAAQILSRVPTATTRFVERDVASYQQDAGRYSRTVTWVYQV